MDEENFLQKEERIRKRVKKIRTFYSSLTTYIAINLLLIVINLLSSPDTLWFYWVTLIWGVGMIVQAFNTFTIRDKFLGEEWEKKKVKDLLEKEQKKGK